MVVVESQSSQVSPSCRFLCKTYELTILGVGTRDYYRRLGYFLDGPYMVKDLLYDD